MNSYAVIVCLTFLPFLPYILFHRRCRLYLSTCLENPHYTAEIYDKVTIVNCAMPKSGLERYLLKLIMANDRADLHTEQKQQTIQLLELKK